MGGLLFGERKNSPKAAIAGLIDQRPFGSSSVGNESFARCAGYPGKIWSTCSRKPGSTAEFKVDMVAHFASA